MNWGSWLLWGFISTLVLTTILSGSQGLRLTRMNIPYMLGTIFTPSRDKAKLLGFIVHLINGWFFSILYVAVFHSLNRASWWLGGVMGVLQAAFVLTAGMHILPGLHPRMASEYQGPTVSRQLEPPGFLALNYGIRTPISVTLAHLVFGVILRAFYEL